MYRHNEKQLEFECFRLPFDGKLRSDNRWVKLANQIPWEEIEELYSSSLSGTGHGSPALSVRVVLGALIIKERLGMSDEETVEQIRENPYLQYFLGLKEYSDNAVFHHTMYVHFRKRFPADVLIRINELIAEKAISEARDKKSDDSDDDNDGSGNESKNKGKLIVDATCAPEDINYPTDLKLLNNARVNLRYCKKYGIRLSGPRLGSPPKETEDNKAKLKELERISRQDEIGRVIIEGKFGQGKRRYGLGRIMTKLSCTSKTVIVLTFLIMNLDKWLKATLLSLFYNYTVPACSALMLTNRYMLWKLLFINHRGNVGWSL